MTKEELIVELIMAQHNTSEAVARAYSKKSSIYHMTLRTAERLMRRVDVARKTDDQ